MPEIIVTTSKAILSIDCDTLEQTVLHQGCGVYFGIAYNDDKLYVAARKDNSDSTNTAGEILVFDKQIMLVDEIKPSHFDLLDLHQIIFWRGKLLCTVTGDDCIAIYDGESWDRWWPEDTSGDNKHYNSLLATDDHLYLLAHNKGSDSYVLRFDDIHQKYNHRYPGMGSQSHDLWIDDDKLFVLSMIESAVVCEDHTRKVIGAGFTRGISKVGEFYYIGVSAVASRGNRPNTVGGLIVCDKRWDVVKRIVLGINGQVLDVKVRQ